MLIKELALMETGCEDETTFVRPTVNSRRADKFVSAKAQEKAQEKALEKHEAMIKKMKQA